MATTPKTSTKKIAARKTATSKGSVKGSARGCKDADHAKMSAKKRAELERGGDRLEKFAGKLKAVKAPAKKNSRTKKKKGTLLDEITIREAMMSPARCDGYMCSVSPADFEPTGRKLSVHEILKRLGWLPEQIRARRRNAAKLVREIEETKATKSYSQDYLDRLQGRVNRLREMDSPDQTEWIKALGWWTGRSSSHTSGVKTTRPRPAGHGEKRVDSRSGKRAHGAGSRDGQKVWRPTEEKPGERHKLIRAHAVQSSPGQAKVSAANKIAVGMVFGNAAMLVEGLREAFVSGTGNEHEKCTFCGAPASVEKWAFKKPENVCPELVELAVGKPVCRSCGAGLYHLGSGKVSMEDQPWDPDQVVVWAGRAKAHLTRRDGGENHAPAVKAPEPTIADQKKHASGNGKPPCPIPSCELVLLKQNPFSNAAKGMEAAQGKVVCGMHLKMLVAIARSSITAAMKTVLVKALIEEGKAPADQDLYTNQPKPWPVPLRTVEQAIVFREAEKERLAEMAIG